MADRIHVLREGTSENGNITLDLEQLLPSGSGFVKVNSDRSLTLETPSGGGTGGQKYFEEVLTITTDNVIPPLSFTPKYATSDAWLTLGSGWVTHSVKEGGFTVNTATRTLTIVAGAQYVVKAGWKATVRYATDDDVSPPTITALSPSPVTVGQTLTLTGTGFTPTAAVTLGGQMVTATFVNATTLTVVLPALPYSGNTTTVQTATGLASNSSFNFAAPSPTISGFTPTLASARTLVVITGTNFTGATAVKVGGADVLSFVVNSATQITADIAKTQVTGVITVQNPYGTATSASSLTIDQLLPFSRTGRVMTAPSVVLNTRTYTASSQPPNGTPYSAFDNNPAVWWLAANNSGQRLIIRFPFKIRISQYRIRQAAGSYPTNHYPKDWTLEGSTNGTTWTVLDTKVNQPINADQTVNIALTDEYDYYSILISNTNGFAAVISELTFDVL